MPFPKRKSPRLQGHDYSHAGVYFITICTENRAQILSRISETAENKLTVYGKIAEEQLLLLEKRFSNIKIDAHVIMPNHIHMLLVVRSDFATLGNATQTIPDIICAFKSITTRLCKQEKPIKQVFQTSFHDHIVRNRADYERIAEYIKNNPFWWKEDCFYKA